MRAIKWGLLGLGVVFLMLLLIVYVGLRASLPDLDAEISTNAVNAPVSLARDSIGSAVITAQSQADAAYALGYAHAQDRLFQMDLLRRQSAGELAEIVGERALEVDKKHRVHQFRKRAHIAYEGLSSEEKTVLMRYTQGVNAGAQSLAMKPFEYILTGSEFAPWVEQDSLLAIYSMYIDLQLTQTEIDYKLTIVKTLFGDTMYNFFTLPSTYQSAIDNSVIQISPIEIPPAPKSNPIENDSQSRGQLAQQAIYYGSVEELPDYGSNNWAVAGALTPTQSAMLSNDMHLGLRVPAIWYRAQLNYKDGDQDVSVTGVSLPGTPAIIVGSNSHIAWGFTNSNVDNVDWVKLNKDTVTRTISETIKTPKGTELFEFEMSQYGPVREFKGNRYALKWVAHQPYAVNIHITGMPSMTSIESGLALAKSVRIPAQNMVIADSGGKVAWQLTGAMTKRKPLARHAISESQYDPLWEEAQFMPANHINPENGRVWSANARVIGVKDLAQFGDGGYALGPRQQQIVNLLLQQDSFVEKDFYDIQLNNEAVFLRPWHTLLLGALHNDPQKYSQDIDALNNWGACACAESVGYTLVRRFRSSLINQLLEPVNTQLEKYDLSSSHILRSIEPAIWALIEQKPRDWLPEGINDYNSLMLSVYDTTKEKLLAQYSEKDKSLAALNWGKVNALNVKHPFSSTLGPFSALVNMSEVAGYGDSYLPAVQSKTFGASQRLIVRPGNEDKGILTVPGGQSGHFMSPYYRTGFTDYATQANTPLLPQNIEYEIKFSPLRQ